MSPQQQLFALQAMLTAGHRCVHLESHTLWLVGGVGGFLCLVTEWVITDTLFPDLAQRGLALLAWLAFWLGSMSLLEYLLTRRVRERRAETLPFAQTQITRAWWMLLAMGCLGSFAMVFHGGGGMIYALWTVLLGLGVYFYGLFSRPLVEWVGLATILLGVEGLAAGLPYGATRWLAAAAFAIGMPLAGGLNRWVGDAGLPRRLAALGLWLLGVVAPAWLATQWSDTPAPLELGTQVLRLEPGARVPLRVELDSPILEVAPQAALELTLARPVEVALREGEPDGRYRIGAGDWHRYRDGLLSLRIFRIQAHLEGARPELRARAELNGPAVTGDEP